jgi:hypothetical protein
MKRDLPLKKNIPIYSNEKSEEKFIKDIDY